MKTKKFTALAIAAAMSVSALSGCGSKSVDADAVVATMDDGVVRLGVANFMARYTQSAYDSFYVSYFGEEYWTQDMSGEGKTMEEDVKEQIMDTLKTDYALAAHIGDYGVEITEEDTKAMEKAAKEFIEANSKETLKAMSATERDIVEYLRLLTIRQRMQEKIEADADTKVSDEEAAQRTFTYVEISKRGEEDDEGVVQELDEKKLKELKKSAQELASGKAEEFEQKVEEAGYTFSVQSYGSAKDEDSVLDEEVLKSADKLKEGGMSKVIETEEAYYVLRLDSEFDEEATQNRKDEIVEERQAELYEKVCEDYTKDFKFEIDEEVWKKVKFDTLFKGPEVEEEEESEETDTEDLSEDADTGDTEDLSEDADTENADLKDALEDVME